MLGTLSGLYGSGERNQLIQDKHVACRNRSLHTGLQCRDKGTFLTQIGWGEWCHWMRKQRAFLEDRAGRKRGRGTASDSKGMHMWDSRKSSSGHLDGDLWAASGNRVWDSWMASQTQRAWVWANFRRQWRTGKPGMLQSTGSQRVGHEWLNNNKSENFLIRGQCLLFTTSETEALYYSHAEFSVPAMNCSMSDGVSDLPIYLRVICEFTWSGAIRKSLSNW